MFLEGHLYYFTPFYFKNGAEPDNKFLIIIKNMEDSTLIASLPTKKNNAPTLIDKEHGCININERKFNCYLFSPNKEVCENGYRFDLPTHVYGNQLKDYLLDDLTRKGTIKVEKDYKVIGKIVDEEFEALVNCLADSNATIMRYRKILSKK